MNKETRLIVDTLNTHTQHLIYPVSVEVGHTRGYKDTVRVTRGAKVLCFVRDRVLYGEGTRNSTPIITGYEWVSIRRGGMSYPDVGNGPFLGRGWLSRLGRVTLRHITREDAPCP